MRTHLLRALLPVLILVACASGLKVFACDDCTVDPNGQKKSRKGCCCSCASGGQHPCAAATECANNQTATCTCDGTSGAASANCRGNTNQGIDASTLFYNWSVSDGNIVTAGVLVHRADPNWQIILEPGFSGGSASTHNYSWGSGASLDTALDTVGSDYGACVDVDYANQVVNIRQAGNCS